MTKEMKRYFYRLLIIFGLLVLSVFLFYAFLLNITFEKEASKNAYQYHTLRADTLNDLIESYYDAYQMEALSWSEKIDGEADPSIPFDHFTIAPLNALFDDEVDSTLMLFLKKENENSIAYKAFDEVLMVISNGTSFMKTSTLRVIQPSCNGCHLENLVSNIVHITDQNIEQANLSITNRMMPFM